MNLDLRTMMVMIAVLSFLYSLLLWVASLHARNIQGLRHWALASLLISFGFALAYSQFEPRDGWAIVFGAALISGGSALQVLGIQVFESKPCHWRLLSLVVAVVIAQSIWLTIIDPNVHWRAILNSLLLASLNFACARNLLISIRPPERTAYWLTGSAFLLLAIVHIARVVTILLTPAGTYGLNTPSTINPVIFFTGSVTHLLTTFGFILMVNYRLASELENLATIDPLTGAWNRRNLEHELQRLLNRSIRKRDTLSVLMLDVDHFKSINDTHGHMAGDDVLRHLTAIAKTKIRSDDFLARYGGEEFCLALPSTTESEAEMMAERLRHCHQENPIYWNGVKISSSISLGIASTEHTGPDISALLKAADQALYKAKQSGRNRVMSYSECLRSAAKSSAMLTEGKR